MAAKHYKYIAKNNILEIKENFWGAQMLCNCIHTHSFGHEMKILHIVYSFIYSIQFY